MRGVSRLKCEASNHDSEAVRCKKLLGDLLDFARTPAPCYIRNNLRNVIQETVKLLKNQGYTFRVVTTAIPPAW